MMTCKQFSFYILLFKLAFTHVAFATQLNDSLCSNSNHYNCLFGRRQQDPQEHPSIKRQFNFVLSGENSRRKVLHGSAQFPGSSPESGKNHKRVRKKKADERLKHIRRRRRRHKRRHSNRFRNFSKKKTFSYKFNHLKRDFEAAYESKNDIFKHSYKSYFPVTKFGNFTSNEIHLPSKEENQREFRKPPFKKRRRSRWRHLNPHSMKVAKLIVRIHNVLRGRVSPPAKNMLAMSWHDAASEQAQRWADECKPSASSDHPSVRWTPLYGTCGQNVHVAFKKKRWSRVVRYWWNERRYFRFGYANNYTKVHQYTQMAWYNSHKVGCGFSQCSNALGKTFYRYVCNYCPGGNDPRRLSKPYSRGRQCESCPNSCKSVCKGGKCRLCTNSCPFSDLWVNCESLSHHWNEWLCNTRTSEGINRFKNCRATCQCKDKIT